MLACTTDTRKFQFFLFAFILNLTSLLMTYLRLLQKCSCETNLAVNILVLCVMHLLSGEYGQTKILVFLTKYFPAEKLVMYIGTFCYKGMALLCYEVFLCSKWNSQ